MAVFSCTTDDLTGQQLEYTPSTHRARAEILPKDGIVGEVNEITGEFVITFDTRNLQAKWENTLTEQGTPDTVANFRIVPAINDFDGTIDYLLEATGATANSPTMGLLLMKSGNTFYIGQESSEFGPITYTCRGCAWACALKTTKLGKRTLVYCSGGCPPGQCQKTESTTI